MKKRNLMLGSAMLLAVLLVAGGTFAWFTASAGPVVNEFTAGTVEIEMIESMEQNGSEVVKFTNVNPGDELIKMVYVKNVGTKKAMVRVHESTVIEDYNLLGLPGVGEPNIDIVKFDVNPKWHYDADTQYFYYEEEVLAGGQTETILVDNKITLDGPLMGNEYQGATFKINLEAEAIQATNGAPSAEGWMYDLDL